MRYRVRNADGEIGFEDISALERGYRDGLIDPDDEVLEAGSEKWVKVSSVKLIQTARPDKRSIFEHPEKRWYGMAGLLVVLGLIMAVSRSWLVTGVLGALVLGGLLTYTTTSGFKKKRSG